MKKKRTKKPKSATKAAAYQKQRIDAADRSRARSLVGRDIGEIPPPKNPERRERCRLNFEAYCREYFPDKFFRPWSVDLRDLIQSIESVCLRGDLQAYAARRGGGKTTIAVAAAEWSQSYGHQEFAFIVGDSDPKARKILRSIKMDFETNPRLAEDFPEICVPIRALEGSGHRAGMQTYRGKRTHIVWKDDEIVLPTIEGSLASSAVIQVSGITGGGLRGPQFTRPDGRVVRPGFIIIDDPQSTESAESPQQCEDRESIIKGAVLGMRSAGQKFGAIMPCTIIRSGDLSSRFLDRQQHPEWHGKISKMLYGLGPEQKPKRWDLWEQYFKIRSDSIRAGNRGKEATEFYSANREVMDEGLNASEPTLMLPDEISAVQNAMNLYLEIGSAAFFAEYQNEPEKPKELVGELKHSEICDKADGSNQKIIPADATHLVSFIDVQQNALYCVMMASDDSMTARIPLYTTYPDQRREYFSKSDIRRTIFKPDAGGPKYTKFEEALWAALESTTAFLLGTDWIKEDGGTIRVERCLVDARWGASTDLVKNFCFKSKYAAILSPSFGMYIGAAQRPLSERAAKPGDRVGLNWIMPKPKPGEPRHVTFDSNFFKGFVMERLRQPRGGSGCLTLYGVPENHRMYADHILSEYPVTTEGRGRIVTEYRMRPGVTDNEFLDGTAGCFVALSVQGASLAEQKQRSARARPKRKLSEFMRG